MGNIYLSVVIPAYNEAKRIRDTIITVQNYLDRQSFTSEIVFVDDGSVDETLDVIRTNCQFPNIKILAHPGNQGKGFAVRTGLMAATGAYRLFSDADNSTPIEELDKFWPYFEQGYDIVIGSRGMKDSDVIIHQALYREYMGRIFNVMVQMVALHGIMDTQCGFKAFTREAVELLFPRQTISGWGFDAELLFIARKHRLRIAEVPIRWFNAPDSRLHSIRDSFHMLNELLSIRYLDLMGLYR